MPSDPVGLSRLSLHGGKADLDHLAKRPYVARMAADLGGQDDGLRHETMLLFSMQIGGYSRTGGNRPSY